MGLFRRRTKWRLVPPSAPVLPGSSAEFVLEATRVRPDAAVNQPSLEVRVSGRREVTPIQGEALSASSVSADLTVCRATSDVTRPLLAPSDSIPLAVRLPWWTPVVRIGDHELISRPTARAWPQDSSTSFETAALPFHTEAFEVLTGLGWRYHRCEVWDVGGKKRPVEQQLFFRPPSDAPEASGFTLADVQVALIPRSPTDGVLNLVVIARKFGPGRFPLGRAGGVPLEAGALREAVADLVRRGTTPDGTPVAGDVLELLLRVLLRP